MKLREMLQHPFGKTQVGRVVKHIGANPRSFAQLVQLLDDPHRQIAARASWCITYVAEEQPALVQPLLKKLIGRLGKTGNASIDRGILQVLQAFPVPNQAMATVFDYCLAAIASPVQPIAVRAFSITVAAKIATQHPDLATELKLVMDALRHEPQSPAIRVRVRNAMKLLGTP